MLERRIFQIALGESLGFSSALISVVSIGTCNLFASCLSKIWSYNSKLLFSPSATAACLPWPVLRDVFQYRSRLKKFRLPLNGGRRVFVCAVCLLAVVHLIPPFRRRQPNHRPPSISGVM